MRSGTGLRDVSWPSSYGPASIERAHTGRMLTLLSPLRDRRAWIVSAVVVVLTLGSLMFIGPPRLHEGSRLVSAILLSFGLGFLSAALVLFVRHAGGPQPGTVLTGLDPTRRRNIRNAVVRNSPVNLPEDDRPYGIEFARAYRSRLPTNIAPFLVLMVGVFLQALSQLRTWDGGFISVCLVLEFALMGFAIFVLVPLQLRRLTRADRFASAPTTTGSDHRRWLARREARYDHRFAMMIRTCRWTIGDRDVSAVRERVVLQSP